MAFKVLKGEKEEDEDLGECWIGGSENDDKTFSGKIGIPLYLTPLPEGNTLVEREAAAVKKMLRELGEEKNKMERKLDVTQNYLTSLQEGKSYSEVAKEYSDKKSMEKTAKSPKIRENRELDKYLGVLKSQHNTQKNLLHDKNRLIQNNDNNIRNNYKELNSLDHKILTISRLIKNNNEKFQINNYVSYGLVIFLIVTIALLLIQITYYGIKST